MSTRMCCEKLLGSHQLEYRDAGSIASRISAAKATACACCRWLSFASRSNVSAFRQSMRYFAASNSPAALPRMSPLLLSSAGRNPTQETVQYQSNT